MVYAHVRSDDGLMQTRFYATKWFEKATLKEIAELAAWGWRNDYPADEVAMYMAKYVPEVANVFRHVENHSKDHIGFECQVMEDSAMRWLAYNRPRVFKAIKKKIGWAGKVEIRYEEAV